MSCRMSALVALVLVFSAARGQALTGPPEVTGTLGGSVSVECSYEAGYRDYSKFWCRGEDWFCDTLVKTSIPEREVRKDRVTIRDSPQSGSFTVVMEGLRPEDAGGYQCGIERPGLLDHLSSVSVAVLRARGQALTGPPSVTGTLGGSVSVECSYEAGYRDYSKYWCRGIKLFCNILVKTSISEREVREGRVTIRDSPRTGSFTVVMEGLRLEDAGTYQCGIDRPGSLDHMSSVSVAVLGGAQTTSAFTSTSQAGIVKEAQPVEGRKADPVVAVISGAQTTSASTSTSQSGIVTEAQLVEGRKADPVVEVITSAQTTSAFTSTSQSAVVKEAQLDEGRKADPVVAVISSAQTTSAFTSTSQSAIVKEAQPDEGRKADPVVAVISTSSPLPPTTFSVKTPSSPPTPSPSSSTNVHSITNRGSSSTCFVEHKPDPDTPDGPHDHDPHPTGPHSLPRSSEWIVLYLLPAAAFLLILLLLAAVFLVRSQRNKKKAFVRSSSPNNGTMQPPDRDTAGSHGVSYAHIQFEEAEQQQDDYINMQVIRNDPPLE